MATTTNYGWVTPDDTALVKDGAAAIRTLGSSADTTTKALNPETTLGDLAYRSSTANVKTRLGIGAANTVLTSNGTEPSWVAPSSGGMTLISTTTLSGATTTLSSIPQTHNSLFLIITGMTANTSNQNFRCLINNTTTHFFSRVDNGAAASQENQAINLSFESTLRTNANNAWALQIDNYTSTSNFKPITFNGFYIRSTSANNYTFAGGAFTSNSAVTSIVFDYGGGGVTFAGGTILLFGVK